MSLKFGILAYPAGHSLSPVMHEAAFRSLALDAVYEKFEIPPEQLGEFLQRVRTEKISGLSVSIPHKIEIIKHLDDIDESAKKIGAVNTVFWRDEQLVGTNTDWIGAVETLETVIELKDKKVVLLGGGGAARAIIYGLLAQKVAEVTVITREDWESEGIKKDFAVPTDFIQNLSNYKPDILINSTPLGMQGELESQSFVPAEYFTTHTPLVFDIVYNPAETRLLADAKRAGCTVLPGLGMLVRQGARQSEIWTGKKAPVEEMQKAAADKLF